MVNNRVLLRIGYIAILLLGIIYMAWIATNTFCGEYYNVMEDFVEVGRS
jgi:hypothetical protein